LAPARASSGDRSWGHVWGFSGTVRPRRGRDAAGNESKSLAGKACEQALFVCLPPAARNLHGKEGVGGSSPPEGSVLQELPANRVVLLSRPASQSTSLLRRPSARARRAARKVPANRPVVRVRRSTSLERRGSPVEPPGTGGQNRLNNRNPAPGLRRAKDQRFHGDSFWGRFQVAEKCCRWRAGDMLTAWIGACVVLRVNESASVGFMQRTNN
jgi:hypothetical protein